MVKKWTHTRGSICICIWVSVYLSICGSTRAHVSVSVSVNVAVSVSAALACVYNTHFKSRWLWHWVSSALSQRTQSRRRPQRRRQRTPTEAAGLGFRGGTMDDGRWCSHWDDVIWYDGRGPSALQTHLPALWIGLDRFGLVSGWLFRLV